MRQRYLGSRSNRRSVLPSCWIAICESLPRSAVCQSFSAPTPLSGLQLRRSFVALAIIDRLRRRWQKAVRCRQMFHGPAKMARWSTSRCGRCFSCSHIGLGGPRVMLTCAQMGIAVGYAAAVGKKHNALPREVGQKHIKEVRALIGYA